jgi:hypothetical protein
LRVTINAGGREVTIECSDANVTAMDIAAQALATWKQTTGGRGSEGPAVGFVPQIVADPRGYADFGNRPLRVTSQENPQ